MKNWILFCTLWALIYQIKVQDAAVSYTDCSSDATVCTEGTTAITNSVCTTLASGDKYCMCPNNFISGADTSNGEKLTCTDATASGTSNICNPDPCGDNGTCSAVEGTTGYKCTCNDNYVFDGQTCIATADQCGSPACSDGQVCQATFTASAAPTYACVAASGASNICDPDPCGENGTCAAVEGTDGFKCDCNADYVFDGQTCIATNKCGGLDCASPKVCEVAFKKDAAPEYTCQDADICDPNPCGNENQCTPVGTSSYKCACPATTHVFDGKTCIAKDECGETTTCGTGKVCQATFTASAAPTYECVDAPTVCTDPCVEGERCVPGVDSNSNPTSVCECDQNYVKVGDKCESIENKCADIGETICEENEECSYDSTKKEYKCECKDGYELDTTTNTCTDKDECASDVFTTECGENEECINKEGRETGSCECKEGYWNSGTGCILDEVCTADDPAPTCMTNSSCKPVVGGYECPCNAGYVGDGKKGCYRCGEEEKAASGILSFHSFDGALKSLVVTVLFFIFFANAF